MKVLSKESGSAFVWTMIVLLVLSILGLAAWNYSLANARQTIINEEQKQAYYFARTGAEVAYGLVVELLQEGALNFNNSFNLYFSEDYNQLMDSGAIVNSGGQDKEIYTTIRYQNTGDEDKLIEIRSVGTKNRFSETVNLILVAKGGLNLLRIADDTLDIPPRGEIDDYADFAASLGWATPGGVIDETEDIEIEIGWDTNHDDDVWFGIVATPGGQPAQSIRLNKGSATYGVESNHFWCDEDEEWKYEPRRIYFANDLNIHDGNTLRLYAGVIIFYQNINLQSTGRLCFHLSVNTQSERPDEPGIVYFGEDISFEGYPTIEAGTYQFPPEGICLPDGLRVLYKIDHGKTIWK